MDDAIMGYHLYPKSMSNLQWMDDLHFSHNDKTESGEACIIIDEIDEKKNGITRVVKLSDINASLTAAVPEADSLKNLPRFEWLGTNVMRYYHSSTYYTFDIGSKETKVVSEFDAAGITTRKTHGSTLNQAYIRDHQLYVKANGREERQLTTDGGDGIVYGEAVHRVEFGITEGLFWSGDGAKLAFYRMDETMVSEFPLYTLSDTPATTKGTRYPVAGAKSHHVTIGIHDLESGNTIYLKTGEPKEQYLTNIAWGPDGKFIYVAVVNREQNHMWFKQFSTATGEQTAVLFEETHEKYVEPEHPAVFLEKSPDQFIWWSERDGYNHLYLYNTKGDMLKQLTKGSWIVTEYLGVNEEEGLLFVVGTKESPLERDLLCVNMKSGKTKRLSRDPGTHTITASPGLRYFIDNFSNTMTPREVRIMDHTGIPYATVHKAEDPLSEYKLGQMEIGSVKANDGTELYYRVFKPVDFDPNKKYPVVVYLYNGPHLQLVRNYWLGGANLWHQYMAQQGFVVFSIDGRGSANRGLDFENAVFRQMGTLEMEDQLAGVDWLKKQGFVDPERLGIFGWSYGGFMTTSLMTRHPGVFKVGVAGGPVIDWRFYEVMYTERYMDTPQENPEGYAKNSLLNYVDKLEGRLLMIHGAQDPTVLWQHSLMYLEESIKKGVTNLDYYVYPHHEHNVRGRDRVHLYHKVTDYLKLYLED